MIYQSDIILLNSNINARTKQRQFKWVLTHLKLTLSIKLENLNKGIGSEARWKVLASGKCWWGGEGDNMLSSPAFHRWDLWSPTKVKVLKPWRGWRLKLTSCPRLSQTVDCVLQCTVLITAAAPPLLCLIPLLNFVQFSCSLLNSTQQSVARYFLAKPKPWLVQ